MPETVEAGINIDSDSEAGLQICFEDMRIDPISESADCETP